MTEQTPAAGWLGLEEKVAVVTGGGGGIGRAVALALGAAGARVAVLDRDPRQAAETARQIQETGRPALAVECNVADAEGIRAAAERCVAAFGPCDVLVNTAALLRPGPLRSLRLEEWYALLSVNLTGYFLCSQVFGGQMLDAAGGAIVHVASIAASHPQGFSGAYSVSKAGVVMLSRQLALEWGPAGVRSNVVSPGMILTPMSRAFYETPGVAERRAAVIPGRRIGRPDDIADAVTFLASPRAGYINGEEVTVDGGFVRGLMNLIPRPGYERPGEPA